MAKTTIVYLSGKCKWPKTVQVNKYGKWSIDLYPDAASLEKIKKMMDAGIKNHLRRDEDGYYMTFTRMPTKEYKGKIQTFSPPIHLKADGAPYTEQILIGNGSDVTLKISFYTYQHPLSGKGAATRLDAIRVDNLIEYTKDDMFDDEKEQIEGLADQPEKLF